MWNFLHLFSFTSKVCDYFVCSFSFPCKFFPWLKIPKEVNSKQNFFYKIIGWEMGLKNGYCWAPWNKTMIFSRSQLFCHVWDYHIEIWDFQNRNTISWHFLDPKRCLEFFSTHYFFLILTPLQLLWPLLRGNNNSQDLTLRIHNGQFFTLPIQKFTH